ncbi:MAG: pyridoxal phosphate-dependent aminotransferase [Oscillospiraceae bacterium]
MFNKKMYSFGATGSAIRQLNAKGRVLAGEFGKENVFNYSIGNPSLPPPPSVYEAIAEILKEPDQVAVHGYSSNMGMQEVRQCVADDINRKFGQNLTYEDIYLTCGSCAALSILFKGLTEPGDEFILIAPFFPEYSVFLEAAGAKEVRVMAHEGDFMIDPDAVEKAVNQYTKAVVIDSPNNPSGAIYTEDNIKALCAVLSKKEKEFGHPIFLISDEPYREVVYDGVKVPYIMSYYDDTIVCYSYSKALSLAGERIGYIAFSNKIDGVLELVKAVYGAGRVNGHACAPTLFQKVLLKCIDDTTDISVYKKNRDILMENLSADGFTFVHPDGAFYLMLKSPVPDAKEFSDHAADKHHLLLVPTDDFGYPGYVRISYCVATDMIERSLPAFKKLAQDYGLC